MITKKVIPASAQQISKTTTSTTNVTDDKLRKAGVIVVKKEPDPITSEEPSTLPAVTEKPIEVKKEKIKKEKKPLFSFKFKKDKSSKGNDIPTMVDMIVTRMDAVYVTKEELKPIVESIVSEYLQSMITDINK